VTLRTIILFSLLWALKGTTQIDPQAINTLPALITEASGLQCGNPLSCWTFNDSDDGSRLFEISTTGAFLSQIILEDALHIDYEDIARSQDGRFFIGDFGNNQNDRTDLRIYITADLDTWPSTAIPTQTIDFTLEDQVEFPPSSSERNYDIESMVHHGDSLYLFTRNRTEPFDGWTKIYRLSDTPGAQSALLVDSLFGNLSPVYSSITGADINPSQQRIALLTSGALYILTDFEDGLGNAQLSFNFFAETRSYEGISFVDDCNILIVEEGDDAQIFSLNTCDILTHLAINSYAVTSIRVTDSELYIFTEHLLEKVQILDALGRTVLSAEHLPPIDLSTLSNGVYTAIIETDAGPSIQRFTRP
jgi:hypothetical protein